MKHLEAGYLSEFIGGELSKQEEQTLRQHLDQCADCMKLYTELCSFYSALQQPATLASPLFVSKVMDEVRTIEKERVLTHVNRRLSFGFFPREAWGFSFFGSVAAIAILFVGDQSLAKLSNVLLSESNISIEDIELVLGTEESWFGAIVNEEEDYAI